MKILISSIIFLLISHSGQAQKANFEEEYIQEQKHIYDVLAWEKANGSRIDYPTGQLVVYLSPELYSRWDEMAQPISVTRRHRRDFETRISYYFSEQDSMVSYIDYSWGIPLDNNAAMRKYFSKDPEENMSEANALFDTMVERFSNVFGEAVSIAEDVEASTKEVSWREENMATKLRLYEVNVGATTYWE